MATNLKIEEGLLNEALKLSGFRTKREAVTIALKEFVAKRKQQQVLKLEGQFEFDPTYDYKEQRQRG